MKMSWGTRIAIVYIAFAVSTLGFVAFASTQTVDLVRTDYYEESLLRTQRTNEERNANELNSNELEAKVTLALTDNAIAIHMPLQFATSPGTVRLYRPSSSSHDVAIPLKLDATGAMVIDMRQRLRGRWDVELSWKSDKVYRLTRKVYN